jgi:DNA-binding beta-propeller fold protein YncE
MTTYDWNQIDLLDEDFSFFAHPGAAVGSDGQIFLGAANGREIHRFTSIEDVTTFAVPTIEVHGLAVAADGTLWITDPGTKSRLQSGELVTKTGNGQVIAVSASGELLAELAPPRGSWMPTAIALDNHGQGSGGRVWVADGYGTNLVYSFDREGQLLWVSDGAASGVEFSCPHGIVVDSRQATPRLLIADRRNRRIVALSLEGQYLESFGSDFLAYPSGLAVHGNRLWVSELYGALVAIDEAGTLVETIGKCLQRRQPAWPNMATTLGLVAPELAVERLHSPHGIAVGPQGDIVVTEWLIGGRATLLSPNESSKI